MRFVINSQVLLKNLQMVGGVVSSNPAMPILENYLFILNNSELSIVGSDLETTITVTVPVIDANEDGRVAIPSKMLMDTIKTFPDLPLLFNVNNDNYGVEISVGSNGNYKLAGEDPASYPELPISEGENTKVELPASVLSNAISKTIFATGNDSLRVIMSGVLFELSPENITFVATDAHKLVRYRRNDVHAQGNGSFVLPKKSMMNLRNIMSLKKEITDISMEYNDRNAFLTVDNVKAVCRLIDGRYPNYETVIPKENTNKLTIDRVSFLTGVKRISIFAEQATPQARLKITSKELILWSEDTSKANEAKERLECTYEGEPMEIVFNAKFLIEMLSNIDTEEISILMSHPSRAGLIVPVNSEEKAEDILMLVMPVTV